MSFYFENFKITEYEIDGKTYDLTNLTLRYKFKNVVKNFDYAFLNHTMEEGLNVNDLSKIYYGDSKYSWLIILSNDIVDPYFDFALDNANFNKYIISKYGSLEYAKVNIHHFERHAIYQNENEKIIDLETPIILDQKVYENVYDENGNKKYPNFEVLYSKEKRAVTIMEYEARVNDLKRNIKILDSQYLPLIENLSEKVFE